MFDDKIAELNRQTELHPPTFEKRTYTVSEIQDILGIGIWLERSYANAV